MSGSELKELYIRAASRARCHPQRTEEAEWKRAFEYTESRDLEAAIESFFTQASGSVRGVWMPKVDELRPLVESARRSREARSSTNQSLVAWKCPVCHLSSSGFLAPGESSIRRCVRCTAELAVVHWDVAAHRENAA